MDYIVINKINCFADISEDEFAEDKYLDKIEELEAEISVLLKKYNIEYDSLETVFLNKKKYSIVRCSNCNHLMIDREKNPVKSDAETMVSDLIYDGAVISGEYLCEDCLPIDHRWSSG